MLHHDAPINLFTGAALSFSYPTPHIGAISPQRLVWFLTVAFDSWLKRSPKLFSLNFDRGRWQTVLGGASNVWADSCFDNDRMIGSAGADQFVLNSVFGNGRTVITDFANGLDEVRATGIPSLTTVGQLGVDDVQFEVSTAARSTYGDHNVIVQGVIEAALGAEDFIFGWDGCAACCGPSRARSPTSCN